MSWLKGIYGNNPNPEGSGRPSRNLPPINYAEQEEDLEVEQVVLFKLSYRIVVDARAYDILLLVQTIILVHKMAELVLDELCLVLEIFDLCAHELA